MADFIMKMQRRIAQISVGPSVVRGAGAGGVSKSAQAFLARLDLRAFAVSSESAFSDMLNKATEELKQQFPGKAQSWGLARKCVKLFLREALYNVYLRKEYGLAQAEGWYEIPLDSNVAKGLRKRAAGERPRVRLPRWFGLKQLKEADSSCYQEYASDRARKEGWKARVHFDLDLWRPEVTDEAT